MIAVDIDDVLASSAAAWVIYSNAQWGTNLTIEDYDEDWAKMWGVDHEEAARRALQINTSGLVGTYEDFREAKAVLERLAARYRLVITSSRVEYQRADTLEWLEKRFGGVFEAIHFGGFYDNWQPDSVKHTKAGLLQSIGADYLIDDQPKHCLAAAAVGVEALLFGEYAWSRRVDNLPTGVTRCKDWVAVGKYFDGRD